MDLGWLPELTCLIIGIGIGTVYGSWITDGWWKEKLEDNESKY